MLSVLRFLLIVSLIGGRGWAWRFRAIFALFLFCLLIFSVVR
jgi:hypothetical protein